MKKNELIASIAEKAGLTKAQAEAAMEAYNATIIELGRNGDRITLQGFGTWAGKTRAAGVMRNPRTGEVLPRPESKTLKFSLTKSVTL